LIDYDQSSNQINQSMDQILHMKCNCWDANLVNLQWKTLRETCSH